MKTKVLFTILSFIALPQMALSYECHSKDLSKFAQELSVSGQMSQSEKAMAYKMAQTAKSNQIISCVGLGMRLSEQEAVFAINHLNSSRVRNTQNLQAESSRLLNLIKDPSISTVEKNLIQAELNRIPQRIQYEDSQAEQLIEEIKKSIF